MPVPDCSHPKSQRTDAGDGRVHCAKCGRDFIPRSQEVHHGTPSGFAKHSRVRKGEWAWPCLDSCLDAYNAHRAEYRAEPTVAKARKDYAKARSKALWRLSRMYARDYAKLFAEELALQREDEDAIIRLEEEADLLLRAGNGGRGARSIEAELRKAIAGRWATTEEKEKWARVLRLRARARELRERAEGEPGGDS